MSEQRPGWRKALKEPNAIGWIGFFLLVIAIGFGTLYFGGTSGTADHPAHSGEAK
jgi:hypothetical protein